MFLHYIVLQTSMNMYLNVDFCESSQPMKDKFEYPIEKLFFFKDRLKKHFFLLSRMKLFLCKISFYF